MKPTVWAPVATALLLSGCARMVTSRVITGPVGPPHAGPVVVVMENAPPPPHFVEVALLQAIGHGQSANLAKVVESLISQAAALGCDAVIRVRIDQGSTQASGTGVCVRTGVAVVPVPAPVR
jgi:hypothetical protein